MIHQTLRNGCRSTYVVLIQLFPIQCNLITHHLSTQRTKTGAAELASLVKSWPAKQKAQLDDALAAKVCVLVGHEGPGVHNNSSPPFLIPQVDATIARYHESAEQALAGSATPGSDPEIIKVVGCHGMTGCRGRAHTRYLCTTHLQQT